VVKLTLSIRVARIGIARTVDKHGGAVQSNDVSRRHFIHGPKAGQFRHDSESIPVSEWLSEPPEISRFA
jgi:hypothetical protein